MKKDSDNNIEKKTWIVIGSIFLAMLIFSAIYGFYEEWLIEQDIEPNPAYQVGKIVEVDSIEALEEEVCQYAKEQEEVIALTELWAIIDKGEKRATGITFVYTLPSNDRHYTYALLKCSWISDGRWRITEVDKKRSFYAVYGEEYRPQNLNEIFQKTVEYTIERDIWEDNLCEVVIFPKPAPAALILNKEAALYPKIGSEEEMRLLFQSWDGGYVHALLLDSTAEIKKVEVIN